MEAARPVPIKQMSRSITEAIQICQNLRHHKVDPTSTFSINAGYQIPFGFNTIPFKSIVFIRGDAME